MNAGLRAWVASHTETRWAIAVAVLCAALVGATLFWPQSPAQQAGDDMETAVRMPVQTPPPQPRPKPEPKPATQPKPATEAVVAVKPGEASAPLQAKPENVKPATKSPTSTTVPAPAAATRGYFVQVGAFRDKAHAETLKKRLTSHHWPSLIQLKKGHMHAVWVGGYASKAEAEKAKAKLAAQEKLPGFITSR